MPSDHNRQNIYLSMVGWLDHSFYNLLYLLINERCNEVIDQLAGFNFNFNSLLIVFNYPNNKIKI